MLPIKKREKKIVKTIRFPQNLANRISKTAEEYNTSFNCLVLEGCEYALNNIKKDKNK